jgi:hypothetical protein
VLPFGPWLDLLRAYCTRFGPAELAEALGATAPEPARLLPELATRLPGLVTTPALEPQQEKHRLFKALALYRVGVHANGQSSAVKRRGQATGDDH